MELRSPNDETGEKIDWYAARGVRELLVVEPVGRTVELHRLHEDGVVLVERPCRSEVLGVSFETIEAHLRVSGVDGTVDI